MTARDDILKTLKSGRSIHIRVKDEGWTVPGEGAAKVLAPLIKSC